MFILLYGIYGMTDFFFLKKINTSCLLTRKGSLQQLKVMTWLPQYSVGEPVSFSLGLQTRVWWEVAHTKQDDFEAAGSLKSPPQLKWGLTKAANQFSAQLVGISVLLEISSAHC